MRLTNFTDFGLRALMKIAGEPDRPHSAAEIADSYRISRNHLTKAMSVLATAGFIKTTRGKGGGAILALPADQVRLGEVVSALERNNALVECFAIDGGACVITSACRLKGIFGSARSNFIADLNRYTLADCALSFPEWATVDD